MLGPCNACGRTLELGRFCPACGAEQQALPREPHDPLIGRVIGDRYEILQLINVGGMGGVYRGRHRALDRTVAIKFVHPHLLTAEDVATRFMIEAQTASRLNHPNVVSIYDFGRTSPDDGGRLFLVMEFLSGPDLAMVLQREGPLEVARVCRVLAQVLSALGEAHQLGIVHRDVKPENLILEPRRSGEEVKIIDFGIAKPKSGRRVTAEGRVMGTPVYMAPEQTTAESAGPGVDLYAVGVILFQLLTGHVPFDGSTPEMIMALQRTAPRPDPRTIAPDRKIPAAIAALCMRSIDVDPTRRFASAEAFAEALGEAMASKSSRPLVGVPPRLSPDRRVKTVPMARVPAPEGKVPGSPLGEAAKPREALAPPHAWACVGRDQEIAWARVAMDGPHPAAAVVLWGHEGAGRTRLLDAVVTSVRPSMLVHRVAAPVAPFAETAYAGLRDVIGGLVRPRPGEPPLAEGGPAQTEIEREGLRTIFAGRLLPLEIGPAQARFAASSALRWALARAASAAAPRRFVLAIDDADKLDRLTQLALTDTLGGELPPGLTILATSARLPEPWPPDRTAAREVTDLTWKDARAIAGHLAEQAELDGRPGGVAPLFLEELARCRLDMESLGEPAPKTLAELVEWRVRALAPEERTVLQAVAVLGRASVEELARVTAHPEDVLSGVQRLLDEGFLTEEGDRTVRIRHAVHARVALALAPRGMLADVHARAADLLWGSPTPIERCAHHALRGRPDLGAFLLVEDCARLRTMHGDDEGAIALLWDGLQAAHAQALLGEVEATDVWIAFGRKLGAALLDASRGDEAMGVLNEVLDQAGPKDLERARVLAQLADIASHRKKLVEAESRRREALDIAERMGDRSLLDRLRRPPPPANFDSQPPVSEEIEVQRCSAILSGAGEDDEGSTVRR